MISKPPWLLAFDSSGAEQLSWDATTPEIRDGSAVEQAFRCAHGALHRIELFLHSRGHRVRGGVRLAIFEGDVSGVAPSARRAPVRHTAILAAETLRADGWFAFEFPPIDDSGGRHYTLRVEAVDAPLGTGVSLRCANGALTFRAACLRAPRVFDNFRRFRRSTGRDVDHVDHAPLKVQLEMSRVCDLHCVMCWRGIMPFDPKRDGTGYLTLERFQTLDAILPDILWIVAFGLGEPLLNRDCLPILRHARARNAVTHVFMSTNATHLTGDTSRAIVAENLISDLNVSVDGAVRSTYEAIRVGGRYDQVFGNLEGLVRERENQRGSVLHLRTEMLVMKDTAAQVLDFTRQMAAVGVDRIILDSPKDPKFAHLRVEDPVALAHVYEQVAEAHRLLEGTSCVLSGPLLHELQEWHRGDGRGEPIAWCEDPCAVLADREPVRHSTCRVPWESFVLATDGVQFCCNSTRPMGDTTGGDMAPLWRDGDMYQKVRSEFVSGPLHDHCELCFTENLVGPNLITPSTYMNACLAVDAADAAADAAAKRGAPIASTVAQVRPVNDGSVQGLVEDAAFCGDRLILSGWARDASDGGGVRDIVISIDGVPVMTVPSRIGRVDVARFNREPYAAYGFWADIPRSAFTGLDAHRVSVSAGVESGRAAPLAWLHHERGMLASLDEARGDAWCTTQLMFADGDAFHLQTASERGGARPSAGAAGDAALSAWRLRALPIQQLVRRRIAGTIDAVQPRSEDLVVRGWAVERGRLAPAKRALLVAGSTVLATTGLGLYRDDVVQALGADSVRGCGFQLTVPWRVLEGRPLETLTVIAVSEHGTPGRLPFGSGIDATRLRPS